MGINIHKYSRIAVILDSRNIKLGEIIFINTTVEFPKFVSKDNKFYTENNEPVYGVEMWTSGGGVYNFKLVMIIFS